MTFMGWPTRHTPFPAFDHMKHTWKETFRIKQDWKEFCDPQGHILSLWHHNTLWMIHRACLTAVRSIDFPLTNQLTHNRTDSAIFKPDGRDFRMIVNSRNGRMTCAKMVITTAGHDCVSVEWIKTFICVYLYLSYRVLMILPQMYICSFYFCIIDNSRVVNTEQVIITP